MIAKKQVSKCTHNHTHIFSSEVKMVAILTDLNWKWKWGSENITSALPPPWMWMIHINADLQVFATDCFWDISPSQIGHYTGAYPGFVEVSTSKWDPSLLLSQTCPKTAWEGRKFVFVDLPLLNSKAKLQKLGIINGWWKKFNFLDKKQHISEIDNE